MRWYRSAFSTRASNRSRWKLLLLSQVPLFRAVEQPMRSAEIMAYPPPQHAHFIKPENKYFGRRRSRKQFCTSVPSSSRFVFTAACRTFAAFQSPSSTMRNSGVS